MFHSFPHHSLVLRLLYERLSKMNGLTLPFQPDASVIEALATYLVEIDDYAIQCDPVDQKEDRRTAFYGWITTYMTGHGHDS